MQWSDLDQDDEAARELRQESEVRYLEDLRASDAQLARLHRLEDYYFSDAGWKPLVFWRLRYYHWTPGLITTLECLRRLHTLMDSEDGRIRYDALCDIEARLYEGKRIWR